MLNEIVAHHDWLPTFLAMAGDPEVTAKLLKGYTIGDMTYKVHIDGYNLVPFLIGEAQQSVRVSSIGTFNLAGFPRLRRPAPG